MNGVLNVIACAAEIGQQLCKPFRGDVSLKTYLGAGFHACAHTDSSDLACTWKSISSRKSELDSVLGIASVSSADGSGSVLHPFR